MKRRETRKRDWQVPEAALCLGLGVLIAVFYFNSFTAGLLFDSEVIVKMDPRLRAVNSANLENILTRNYWWPSQENTLYRPLTTLTYLFNYAILGNGENPAGYHVVNFLLHWMNAWLVLLIVRRLAGRLDVALLTAGLFAVHPVNTEAVTNVVGRADLLATFCVLLGSWAWLRADDAGAHTMRLLMLAGLAGCLGVLAKENAVMIVGFAALYELLWRRPFQETSRWLRYAALLPALLLVLFIRNWMASSTMVFADSFLDNPLVAAAPFQRLMTALGVTGRYLQLVVFPWKLSADYSFNQIPLYGTGHSVSDAVAWMSIGALALMIGAAIYLRQREKILAWSLLFFLVMLLPTANLVITIGSIMAERFLYLPSIGFCAAAAVVIIAAGEKCQSRWVLPVALILALGIRTFVRNQDWQNDLTLWSSTAAAAPESYKAHMVYGEAILADVERSASRSPEQAVREATAQHEAAASIVETNPPLPLKWRDITIYLHLAKDYRLGGLYEKSLAALSKAQEIDRFINQASREFRLRHGIPPEQILDVGNFYVYESLCLTYAKLELWDKCEEAGRYLEHIAPQQSSGYQLLGTAYLNLGRYPEAAKQFLAGLMLDPERQDWYQSLNAIYEKMGVEPNPVVNRGGTFVLNKDAPIVRDQLNEARALREKLIREKS